jgi:hypothetical protein
MGEFYCMEHFSMSAPANAFSSVGDDTYTEDNARWQSTLSFQQNQLTYMRDTLSDKRMQGMVTEHASSNLYYQLNLQLAVVVALLAKLKEQEGVIIHSVQNHKQDIHNMEQRIKQESLRDEILYFEQQYLQLKQDFRQFLNNPY